MIIKLNWLMFTPPSARRSIAESLSAMRAELQCLLSLPTPACMEALDVPALLNRAAAPWLVVEPAGAASWPSHWHDAASCRMVRVRLFGWLSLGWHRLEIESRRFPGPETSLRLCLTRYTSNGRSTLWLCESLTTLVPASGGTRHTDWLEMRAGWLTPLA